MGIAIALAVIVIWAGHLIYALQFVSVDLTSPATYLHILIQGYLYTGLFITAHDGMHGTIAQRRAINDLFGTVCSLLFAGLSYRVLRKNHFEHHRVPGEAGDPDFSPRSQNFFVWWGTFLFRYATVLQLIIMAVLFNVLKIWFAEPSVWAFWVVPAFIGAFQLFYFGTFVPHRLPHTEEMKPHNSRTLKRNHIWAMLSCYFFGYHYEHHESPGIPWWRLYQLKK